MRDITTLLFFYLFSLSVSGQTSKLEITPLKKDFYIFTTYNTYKGTTVPANGMYLVTKDGVVMFDAPWDTTQFQPLLDSIKIKHNKTVVMDIATHSHEDRTAGLEFLKQQGARTYTSKRTDRISREKGNKRAEYLFEQDTTFTVGQYSFVAYYPGEGHTVDNIVIWFDQDKVLYGGCLVKSTEAKDLGNITEANIKAWPVTIRNIQSKFKKPQYIIPGHQDWRSNKSLDHTVELLKK